MFKPRDEAFNRSGRIREKDGQMLKFLRSEMREHQAGYKRPEDSTESSIS